VREERVAVRDLPAGLEGFRVAQLSDLHGGSFLRAGDLREVVEATNELRPDLCALTGDFVTHDWREVLPILPDLGRLRARHGVLGVLGNHDYRGRCEGALVQACAEHGVRLLRDACVRIDTGAGVLAVVGLEDLEEARSLDPARARADVRPGDVELVLCHNPAGGPHLARPQCAAVLSGHTHGNQLDLPVLRRMGPPHPGARVQLGATALIVNRGLGVIGLPLRRGAPSEVVLVRLERGSP
jgi:uncharacterized protein